MSPLLCCLANVAITFDASEQRFNSIALDGTYDTWSVERLQAFVRQIEASLTSMYPNSAAYDDHLKRPPSTISESLSAMGSGSEEGENKEQEIAESVELLGTANSTSTTRAKLPAKLTGSSSNFSAATVRMLEESIVIEHFPAKWFSDQCASQQSHLHLEIARKMIKWKFYQTDNIQPFISPSKNSLNTSSKPANPKCLTENYVQKILSRVLFPLCKTLDVTLHDARSYPKVH